MATSPPAPVVQRIEQVRPKDKMCVQFMPGALWAYGIVVERGIRIAETAVRFCLGPQSKQKTADSITGGFLNIYR